MVTWLGACPALILQSEEATIPKPKSMSLAEQDEPNNNELDPLIDALLSHLPQSGEPFPNRKLWMQIMDLVLTLVYPEAEPEPAT